MLTSVACRNPFYKNEKKTVEPHLLHTFTNDFYDEELRLVVCGYLRPEKNYSSLDALIKAIHDDIATAKAALDTPEYAAHAQDPALKPRLQ
jgi:riboflavin kinase